MVAGRPERPPTDGYTQRDIWRKGAGGGIAADAAPENGRVARWRQVFAYGWLSRLDRQPGTREVYHRYICATKRSFIYPAKRGEIGGVSLDPMADPEPKGPPGENSMPGNQRSCPGVRDGALGDLRDMAKAILPEA
jgi:hypothetical protein